MRPILGGFLVNRYNVKAKGLEEVKKLTPPYLIMPNHVNTFDVFFVAALAPDPIFYVASDNTFRNPVVKWLLGLVGAIPKMKGRSDFETVRHIMKIRDAGGVIGIFPEGKRNWDGHSVGIIYSTAKLVKLLKVLVVMPQIRGGYLSLPRWSKVRRQGEIEIDYSHIIDADQLIGKSVDEIYSMLSKGLAFNEYEWQRQNMIPFKADNRAEYLEYVLFLCPSCGGKATLHSEGNCCTCSECGYSVEIEEYGFFTRADGSKAVHSTVRDWYMWQWKEFIPVMEQAGEKEELVLFKDRVEFIPVTSGEATADHA